MNDRADITEIGHFIEDGITDLIINAEAKFDAVIMPAAIVALARQAASICAAAEEEGSKRTLFFGIFLRAFTEEYQKAQAVLGEGEIQHERSGTH